jgi:hypothetical protein
MTIVLEFVRLYTGKETELHEHLSSSLPFDTAEMKDTFVNVGFEVLTAVVMKTPIFCDKFRVFR